MIQLINHRGRRVAVRMERSRQSKRGERASSSVQAGLTHRHHFLEAGWSCTRPAQAGLGVASRPLTCSGKGRGCWEENYNQPFPGPAVATETLKWGSLQRQRAARGWLPEPAWGCGRRLLGTPKGQRGSRPAAPRPSGRQKAARAEQGWAVGTVLWGHRPGRQAPRGLNRHEAEPGIPEGGGFVTPVTAAHCPLLGRRQARLLTENPSLCKAQATSTPLDAHCNWDLNSDVTSYKPTACPLD